VIDFLIRNKAYQYCRKTGKIFFRILKKAEDEKLKAKEFILDFAKGKEILPTLGSVECSKNQGSFQRYIFVNFDIKKLIYHLLQCNNQ
jgi:hypothetical protein